MSWRHARRARVAVVLAALAWATAHSTRARARCCGATRRPPPTGCGPSIVDGRVLWGYGFTLFSGPGPGGLISFTLTRP